MSARSLLFQLEAAVARLALAALRRMGPVRASNFAAAIARTLGPLLPVSKIADANLRLALPELDAPARQRIIRGVWDNLGRNVGEFPHLADLTIDIVHPEIPRAIASAGKPAILITGHIGNWEVMPQVLARFGMKQGNFYRPASNAAIDGMIQAMRLRAAPGVPYFPKGAAGARAGVALLRKGGVIGMLVDQKLNDGIAVPLFGHMAMTAPAPAALALRFDATVAFACCERVGPAHLRVVWERLDQLPATGNRDADVLALTTTINATLERWIRARPQEWLWLHRRWPKSSQQGA